MRRRTGVVVLLVVVAGFAMARTGPSVSAAESPSERVRVAPAGISFVVPGDWGIDHNFTREQVERLAQGDPDLSADALLMLPFSAGWYDVGSDYPDRMLDIVVNGKAKDYKSPTALRRLMSRGGAPEDLSIERTTVGGKPALVARFTTQTGRDDDVPMHFTSFYLVGPKGPMYLSFYSDEANDPDFDAIRETVLDSVHFDAK